ncbi:MAG TPA: glycosyltransferase family 2 protein [Aquaticitalea sp.]|nr:glycosyltransferase family 2 protein [Aquaticitalea sp.]
MISVCIPVYNYNASALVNALIRQSDLVAVPVEIIVIDDGSSNDYKSWHKPVSEKFRYFEMEKNIGRAKIRNLFLEYAQYEYLLFLDCDALVVTDDFIETYIKAIAVNASHNVFCGGRIFSDEIPAKSQLLRWKYGKYRESQPVSVRERKPNNAFMTNNFLIGRQVFSKHKFDERIYRYGHEDTLFGYVLKKNNIEVKHIHNPICNGDLESNAAYLQKTEEALKNLCFIVNDLNEDQEFIDSIRLLHIYFKLKVYKLTGLLKLTGTILRPLLKAMLLAGWVHLKLFDLYKLVFFVKYYKKTPVVI